MTIFGGELRDARGLMDLTQAELATRLGVSPRTIVSWESSRVADRSERKVMRVIAPALYEIRAEAEHSAYVDSPEGREALELEAWERDHQPVHPGDFMDVISHGRSQALLDQAAGSLSDYDDVTLLHELLRRRHALSPRSDYASVSPAMQDDAEELTFSPDGLAQGDYDLAAKRGTKKADQQAAE